MISTTPNSNFSPQRIAWIDVAKGFTAISVVLGHILTPGDFQTVIYAFHVPAFFFISGLCFSPKESFVKFLKLKTKKIMLPYYIWGLIAIAIYLLAGKLVSQDELLSLKDCIIGLLYGTSKTSKMQFNLHLWFLPVLFIMQLLYFPIVKVVRKFSTNQSFLYILSISIVLTAISILLIQSGMKIYLPLGIITAIKLLPFFSFGYLYKFVAFINTDIGKSFKSRVIICFITTSSLLLLIFLSLKHFEISGSRVNYTQDRFGNLPLFIFASISGIVFIIALSVLFSSSNTLAYIGKRTLPLLVMQKFPIMFFRILPLSAFYIDSNNIAAIFAITAITVILCLTAEFIISKYLPFLYGMSFTRRTKNEKKR